MAGKKFRWRYFIDKPFQIRFIARFLILILLGLGISLGVLLIANSQKFNQNLFFQVKNVEYDASGKFNIDPNAPFYEIFDTTPVNVFQIQMYPMIWMSVLYLVLIIFFGLFISHKMAGPVYRIKKTLQEVADGRISVQDAKFRLRKRDELKDLVESLNAFLDKTGK